MRGAPASPPPSFPPFFFFPSREKSGTPCLRPLPLGIFSPSFLTRTGLPRLAALIFAPSPFSPSFFFFGSRRNRGWIALAGFSFFFGERKKGDRGVIPLSAPPLSLLFFFHRLARQGATIRVVRWPRAPHFSLFFFFRKEGNRNKSMEERATDGSLHLSPLFSSFLFFKEKDEARGKHCVLM